METGGKTELEMALNREGLTVLLKKDYDAILLEVVRLRQLERAVRTAAKADNAFLQMVRLLDGSAS